MQPFPAKDNASFSIRESSAMEITTLLTQGVSDGVAPAISLLIAEGNKILFLKTVGQRGYDQQDPQLQGEVNAETVFDIGSLTLPLITTTILMRLHHQGLIDVHHKVSRYIQSFNTFGKEEITIADLLSHTSGLAAYHPFYQELTKENAEKRLGILTSRGARDYIYNAIIRSQLRFEPRSRCLPSDLGGILLGLLIETASGMNLDTAFQRLVAFPLGLKSTGFIDLALSKRRGWQPAFEKIAPTEECQWRKRILCGEPFDENCAAMGGIAGHSGIFTNILDCQKICCELIAAYQNRSGLISGETIKLFWSDLNNDNQNSGTYGINKEEKLSKLILGWEIATSDYNNTSGFGEEIISSSGNTGCFIWLNPTNSIQILLFSNTVHPVRANKKIQQFKEGVYAMALNALRLP